MMAGSAGEVCYLGLGANLGARAAALAKALLLLDAIPGVGLARVSSVYETAPEGVTDQPAFLNMVVGCTSTLAPEALLEVALGVETSMGRVRTLRWGPRAIDIDLLVCGETQSDTERLTLPHPRLAERQFVLVPLAEIAPEVCLPDGRRAGEAADPCSPGVRRLGRLAQVVRSEQLRMER
jgi:2-amino-4-hydroxy-6-hydroxymethyldihydropteridine diphosphokinase